MTRAQEMALEILATKGTVHDEAREILVNMQLDEMARRGETLTGWMTEEQVEDSYRFYQTRWSDPDAVEI